MRAVGFVGLGNIGKPMALRLLTGDVPVWVYDVAPSPVAELEQAGARVAGDLQHLLMLVKGLPLAYNRDLQEDKIALFDAFDTVPLAPAVAT